MRREAEAGAEVGEPIVAEAPGFEDDPLWYRDAVIYQLHVKAFHDSNGDGVGDFSGLTEKLDYLQALGVTALWVLPFYPSPQRDDGYDIADYGGVHASYGSLEDFERFLHEAHNRGLRVITELVINHTSEQHGWFQRARRAPEGSSEREFYVWTDDPSEYSEARIIFKDFEHSNWAYDHIAERYYWHRFYSHQPDLNFENPAVREAIYEVMDRWFDMGVDGMRLDAIPYLHEREGTSCENLPETHEELKRLRAHLDANHRNRMLLAEANQWPEDAAEYFGDGDECHMNFHFPLMPRLFMALRMEDRFPIIDILKQTPDIPAGAQWAIFLRNHDELTLEMVTDEERDYMYRVYAHDQQARINLGIRRRLAPLLENNRRKIELMNSLLLSLPGTPVIYYGDEIGMGDNIYLGDRSGVRTPMQWSADRNGGFSRTNPQRLYLPVITDPEYHFESVNVEAQENNPSSLLWWMRRLIGLRKRYRAFGRGGIRFLSPANRKVLAFVREHEDEQILVIVNLSRFTQYVDLDLAEFEGEIPVELFGQTEFPEVTQRPYFLTLGPHAFYWFELRSPEALRTTAAVDPVAVRQTELATPSTDWRAILRGRGRARLETLLPRYLRTTRWFRGKARPIRSATIEDLIPLDREADQAIFVLTAVEFIDGEQDTYVLPLAYAPPGLARAIEDATPRIVIARLRLGGEEEAGALYDALYDETIARSLLEALASRRRLRGERGSIEATSQEEVVSEEELEYLAPRVLSTEQSNTSVAYGSRWVLKLFRRLEDGISLDLELGRHLTDIGFEGAPAVGGALEYRGTRGGGPRTLGVLNRYVENEGDAWKLTLDELRGFLERALAAREAAPPVDVATRGLLDHASRQPPERVEQRVGTYMDLARLLGRRTAEMHVALASATEDAAFAPEPFNPFYRRSLYQSMRNQTGQVLQALGTRVAALPEAVRAEAMTLIGAEDRFLARFRRLIDERPEARRIRTHGDYHLGQVLYTGKDFIITDFEGEPARPLSERRIKRSALRDVAGMLRSFHYAAYTARLEAKRSGLVGDDARETLDPWMGYWYAWVSGAFLRGYLDHATVRFVPAEPRSLEILLDAYMLEKALYEVGYEMNNRPDWIEIPIRALLEMLRDGDRDERT